MQPHNRPQGTNQIIETIVPDMTEGTTLIGKLERGKGSQISKSEVLAYKEISAVAHEFAAMLQF